MAYVQGVPYSLKACCLDNMMDTDSTVENMINIWFIIRGIVLWYKGDSKMVTGHPPTGSVYWEREGLSVKDLAMTSLEA